MFKIKNLFGEWYQPQNSFVVRNPLFPIEQFYNWTSKAETDPAKEILRKSLREFYLQPIAQEALYIGSPDLHEQLQLWLDNKIDKADKKEKTELSLVKYMTRMCARCTPYGLFASCSVGNFSEITGIELSPSDHLQRFGRLDMDYVCQLYIHLLQQKDISSQLLYSPNTSLYRCGDQWRYIEHRFSKETGRSYHLVEIDHSPYVEKILTASEKGRRPEELALVIAEDEITHEEAFNFIDELIHNQVLVNELAPTVTGEDFSSVLLRSVKALSHTEKAIEQLEKISSLFEQLKDEQEKEKNKIYQQIVQELQSSEVPVHLKTLVQVDSYRPASNCSLNKNINEEILKGLSLLQLLTPQNQEKDQFEDFKKEFTNRYEGEFVPLVEVLDTESGIGYSKFGTTGMEESPLIDKLPIGNGFPNSSSLQDADNFKWNIYQKAIAENKTVINIDDTIIEQLSKKEFKPANLPDSICTMIKINAASAQEIDNGNYTISLQSPSGPSGANLLGRFCHVHPGIANLALNILKEEEAHRTDCVFAEIAHLPESRVGNILMRPVLRKYEIPYLCGTTLEKDLQIPVVDLLVGIESDKVVLRSKKLNKEVIPRLTTAHNFNMTTLPVYQFLCDLQFQKIRNIGWYWGVLDNRPFLPRVSYGRFIFSKARWILTKEDVKDCDKKNDEELQRKFAELKHSKRLPDYILLSQGDNELLLDLKNIFCTRLLLSEVNKNETAVLTETLDLPGQCWIQSPEGLHPGEFIFAFTKKKEESVNRSVNSYASDEKKYIKRYFTVGEEWLYAKIYCGTKTSEKLLAGFLRPFTKELLLENLIDKFFFLRYQDPAHHIRIRFHNSTNKDFWKEIISRLRHGLQQWFEDHLVHNLQFETYRREVERYSPDTMELSENIFWHQSEAVMDFISMLEGDEGEQYRWQVALKAIDSFLNDFSYTLEKKRDLVKLLNRNFSEEFKIGSAERKKISERFSSHKQIIQVLLSEDWQKDENLSKAVHVFTSPGNSYRQTIKEILDAPSVKAGTGQLDMLMSSYLHMFINRLFVSNQRKIELVIYEYLFKYYESKIAREKSKPAPVESINRDDEISI